MPPRIPRPILSPLSGSSLCIRPATATKAFKGPLPTTLTANGSTSARKKQRDPYAIAQAAQRKAANVARQRVLQEERTAAMGDPIRGIRTPFVESFDDVGGAAVLSEKKAEDGSLQGLEVKTGDNVFLNHFVKPSEFEESIIRSHLLSRPLREKLEQYRDPAKEAEELQKYEEEHERAMAALTRIVSLANASQKDKTRANIQRCIQTFGRHETDSVLRPRPPINPVALGGKPLAVGTPRAGPDTGSSEVQIAILTAKINVLANQLEKKGGTKDKVNKRNLRLMVHKRQKLLSYLRKKERGSDRWQNLVSTLGLTEGTWKGEISL
ncbi:Ribosomal protein-like protein S15 [Venustampulla echinocandica]|uniref:Ribosomal protein-like protein S15 n=1 Tax=Venustampulla echinocandica TaxID=2656787 RepID=A0A370U0F0_9HELO|nr:Ribosomal protein-like protein S15 [Venustampulla echinocandica]RDL41251.1 Ribosomal protein-like protein S15 [Venustampulla echinocandica]